MKALCETEGQLVLQTGLWRIVIVCCPGALNSFAGDCVESKHSAVEKLNKLLRINTEQKWSAGPRAAGQRTR